MSSLSGGGSSGSASWGGITGTLSNQTDLQSALNGKMTAASVNFGTIDGYDPTGQTEGNVHATVQLTASPQTISTGFTNPRCPRNVYVNDQDGAGSGVFTIHGTDASNASISDTVDLGNGPQGSKCFKTFTSIDCPASNLHHFDFSTGDLVGFTTTHSNAYVGIPVLNNTSQISNSGFQQGYSTNANIDGTNVCNNNIQIGSVPSPTCTLIFYVLVQ